MAARLARRITENDKLNINTGGSYRMIIEKIDIRSFGALTDLSLEFSDSVNVIEGQNEAGKSTIAAFIKYMLFGFEGVENDSALGERKKRINWTTGVAQGSMIVRVKGKRYLVSRSTVYGEPVGDRPTYKEDSSIIDMETGATAFGKFPAGEVFFGVSRELYENTAFVGQIGDAGINEGSVQEAIENILFSASEKINNQRAMSLVTDKMEGLLHRGGHGGAIYDLVIKRDDLEEKLKVSKEDNKQILAKEAELHRIKTERQEAENMLNKLYELDSCYKNVMLIQTFEKLHELEEDAAAKGAAYSEFITENTRAGYVPTEAYLTELGSARRAVNESYYTLREAEDTYSREKNAIGITHEIENAIEVADRHGGEDRVQARADRAKKSIVSGIALSILTALVALAAVVTEVVATGALAGIALRVLFGVIGAGAAAGAVYFILGVLKARGVITSLSSDFGVTSYLDLIGKLEIIKEAREKRDNMIRSTEAARKAVESARIAYDNAKAELTRVIVRWGEEPPTSELNLFLDRLEARVLAFLERKRLLLEEKNTAELTVREIRSTLSDKNEIDIRAQVSPIKRKALATINHDEIITGIASFKAKIVEKDRLAFGVESELVGLKSRAGDPGELYAKIALLDARIDELKAKHKAYFVAHKSIESASDDLRDGISPRLGEYATYLMGIMTDKKYSDFDVSDGLKVSFVSEDGERRTVDFLSGGTRDIAYIAVRMALIDMLFDEKPPLVFDESFAHQDNLRAKSMMKAVAHLAEDGQQSFIFTCRAREAALATELVKGAGVFTLSMGFGDIA